jgi:inosine-uridine nucleoside N-ribohydrolase
MAGSRLVARMLLAAGLAMGAAGGGRAAQPVAKTIQQQLVWVDTDIGDDIDDVFALGLILRNPEFKVLGISTAFGDTELRARLVDRFLASVGRTEIPVLAGVKTQTDNPMTQAPYARRSPAKKHADGVVGLLAAIRAHPGQVTLIAIGPLFNIGAAIDRDPATFAKLKRVVMMGGSVRRGYDGQKGELRPPDAEWNIKEDPKGAGKLFAAGVPIFMMPLDSTQIHLEPKEREEIFALGSPLTDQLTLLYHQWEAGSWNHSSTPTLFDPVAVAYAFHPELCPMTPMRIAVDGAGMTKQVEGTTNAQVCLKSDEKGFLKLLVGSLVEGEK